MSSISISGDKLGILIDCENSFIHHWMAFASWYSINRNLPDANVVVACRMDNQWDLFGWVYKCKVPIFRYRDDKDLQKVSDCKLNTDNTIIITAYDMAVREYDDNAIGPIPVNTDKISCFVSCTQGCGKFITEDWIKVTRPPFHLANKRFRGEDITVNELKVLNLWSDCYRLYTSVGGG